MDNSQFKAAQLRRPHGAEATSTAEQMNSANHHTNIKAIEYLQLKACNRVLEIGPGNGRFVANLLSKAPQLSYVGIDWSAEMVEAGYELNADLVAKRRIQFVHGSSDALPFPSQHFDRVLSVHTLYFWEKPLSHLREIYRALTVGGLLCLAIGEKSFMKDLPFTNHGFTLYDEARTRTLLKSAGFIDINSHNFREVGESNTGTCIEKTILILTAKK